MTDDDTPTTRNIDAEIINSITHHISLALNEDKSSFLVTRYVLVAEAVHSGDATGFYLFSGEPDGNSVVPWTTLGLLRSGVLHTEEQILSYHGDNRGTDDDDDD